MWHRNEPRAGRCCLEGQMADSGLLDSAEVGSHRLSGPSGKYSQSIEIKDIKWSHLVLFRMPPHNLSVMHPWINFWHFDSCGKRKNNLERDFPEGLEGWAPRFQYFLLGPLFLAQIGAYLTQRLGQESPFGVPLISVEELSCIIS